MTKLKLILFTDKNIKDGKERLIKIYQVFAEVTGNDPTFIVSILFS